MNRATEIEAQAAQWLVRLDGHPTNATREEFNAWVSASLRHRAAFLRLSSAWATTDRLRILVRPEERIDADLLKPRRATKRWYRPLFAAATMALVAAVGLRWWGVWPADETYRTEIGGYSRIVLLDGSAISLNTDSEVHVRLASKIRDITLVKGEAIFEVAHDVRRPFDVHAGSTVIRAVGTAFDVRQRDEQKVEVLVTEGKVSVTFQASAFRKDAKTPRSAILAAGEAGTAGTTAFEIKKIDQTEVARHLAWQAGELSFQGESLTEVISEFNRYNRRHLELTDPGIRGLRVGGNFKANDLDSFVGALHASFGLVADSGADGTRRIHRPAPIAESPLATDPPQ
jgi:transmembrane sensor